jgi:hypothetical protein
VARRFGLMLATVGLLLASSASALGAVAPLAAPVLTSAPYASPVVVHWTPGPAGDGGPRHGHGHGGDGGVSATVQAVLRADGTCAAPLGPARSIATFADTTTSDYSDAVADGTYCYSIEVTDATSTAESPGLTVFVDALAAVPTPPAAPIAVVAPVAGGAAIGPPAVGAVSADQPAPAAATRFSVSVPRAKAGTTRVPVTVRWVAPDVANLVNVEVVMNATRPPRDATDGKLVYRGLGTSTVVTLRAGQRRYLALFASDGSGAVSVAARQVVSLASLVPLRPLTGSLLSAAPLLTWRPWQGAKYYNVQLFRNGRRVFTAWPSQPSYRIPAAMLSPGTYVWYVWPAVATRATPRFAALIGRATFVYSPSPAASIAAKAALESAA